MDLEDLSIPNSWISIQAIRDAADIKSSIKLCCHRKTMSSPPETPSNIFVNKKKLKINSPSSIQNFIHTRNNTASIDSFTPLPYLNLEIPQTDKKNKGIITKLNEEIMILSTQLTQANTIILQLTKKLNEINNKHALHIQALQQRHEQKIKKNKQDVDCLLNEMYLKKINQLTESLKNQYQQEMAKQQEKFQKDIYLHDKSLQDELEKNNYEHQKQINLIKDHCIALVSNLKQRFFEEIERIELRNKEKIKSLRERYKLKYRISNCTNEEDSTAIGEENESDEEDQENEDEDEDEKKKELNENDQELCEFS